MSNITANEGPLLNVNVNLPSKAKIELALKQLKNGKAEGPDGIPPEALKDTKTTLYLLFLQIWKMEKVPLEWTNGRLVKLPKRGDLELCKNWRGPTPLNTQQGFLSNYPREAETNPISQNGKLHYT